MSFREKNYSIIKGAVSNELAQFCCDYFLLKEKVADTLFKEKFISPYSHIHGIFGDTQVNNAFACYADLAMETLLVKTLPKVEESTGLKLYPTYSYARVYRRGSLLKRHIDRFSCQISTTLFLGGSKWPIYIDSESNNKEISYDQNGNYIPRNKEGVEINLEQGDMLLYKGSEYEHWRDGLNGDHCVQVFLHYNIQGSTNEIPGVGSPVGLKSESNIFDGRPHLGLPVYFKKNK